MTGLVQVIKYIKLPTVSLYNLGSASLLDSESLNLPEPQSHGTDLGLQSLIPNFFKILSTMHFIGRVTMLFANNSLINGMSDHHEIFTHFFFTS